MNSSTSPLTILLVTDYGTPTGGDELLTFDLRDGLRARGHDARVFTSDARPLPVPIAADYTCRGTTSRWRTLLQSANPYAPATLRRVLTEFDPHLIHVRSYLTQLSPTIIPLMRGRASILHFDTLRAVCPSGSKLLPDGEDCRATRGLVCLRSGCLPLRDWVALTAQLGANDRMIDGAFDACITNSAHMRDRLRAGGVRVDDFVWNGTRVPAHAAERAARPTVAYAGRLVREKGVDVLLRATAEVLRAHADVALVVAGDGPERPALERLARELAIEGSVEFTGHLSRDVLERRIGGAWVHVVPSLWAEPFGLVTIEAMARGTAVVASDAGGSAELIVDGDTGLLVAPGNATALAAALRRLIDAPALGVEIGRRARAFAASRTSIDSFVDAVERLYRRVLGARAGLAGDVSTAGAARAPRTTTVEHAE